jgi:hypothetical protein
MLPGIDIFNTRSDGLHHMAEFVRWDPEKGWQTHVRIIRPVPRGEQVYRRYGSGDHDNANLLTVYGFTEKPLQFTTSCSAAVSAEVLPSYEITMVQPDACENYLDSAANTYLCTSFGFCWFLLFGNSCRD